MIYCRSNIKIKITAYEIKNNKKNPYLLYLLYKDELTESLFFPELPTMYPNVNSDNVIKLSKLMLFNLLSLTDHSEFDKNIRFKGFYLNGHEAHIVFDLTDCKLQIYDVYRTNHMWFTLLDEIINHKKINNFL